jgi:hypothetical protein
MGTSSIPPAGVRTNTQPQRRLLGWLSPKVQAQTITPNPQPKTDSDRSSHSSSDIDLTSTNLQDAYLDMAARGDLSLPSALDSRNPLEESQDSFIASASSTSSSHRPPSTSPNPLDESLLRTAYFSMNNSKAPNDSFVSSSASESGEPATKSSQFTNGPQNTLYFSVRKEAKDATISPSQPSPKHEQIGDKQLHYSQSDDENIRQFIQQLDRQKSINLKIPQRTKSRAKKPNP